MSAAAPDGSADVYEEGGVRKAICGYTWPGIEHGEPPSCPYTFFEYVDAIRFGDLAAFRAIEAAAAGWWHARLDRGAGAALHFAADHGQLAAARFLVERRGAAVNQRCLSDGATPLVRAARVAHRRDRPALALFEYLLARGADPALATWPQRRADGGAPEPGGRGPLDVAVRRGHGWAEGEVRAALAALLEKHAATPRAPEAVHAGGPVGPEAARVLAAWEAAPKLYPPRGWRPPPPPGCVGAQGWRPAGPRGEGWRPAGDGDGAGDARPMTPAELDAQARAC